jgi:hypothetical protein
MGQGMPVNELTFSDFDLRSYFRNRKGQFEKFTLSGCKNFEITQVN